MQPKGCLIGSTEELYEQRTEKREQSGQSGIDPVVVVPVRAVVGVRAEAVADGAPEAQAVAAVLAALVAAVLVGAVLGEAGKTIAIDQLIE